MRPVPTERVTSFAGRTAGGLGAPNAGAGTAVARLAAIRAAEAVPTETRLRKLVLCILLGSDRNEGDGSAAGDADDGAGGDGLAGRSLRLAADRAGQRGDRSGHVVGRVDLAVLALGRDGAALEAGDIGADRVGWAGVDRMVGDREQHLALRLGIGAGL